MRTSPPVPARLAALAVAALMLAACAEGGTPSGAESRSLSVELPSSTRTVDPTTEPTRDEEAAGEPARDEEAAGEPARDEEAAGEPTRDEEAAGEPTRDEEAAGEPTRDEEAAEPQPTSVRTLERTVEHTVVHSVAPQPDEEPTEDAPVAAAPTQAAEDPQPAGGTTSSWFWWLLVAVLGALGAGAWFMQSRSRRQEWERGIAAAAGEATWLARELVPELAAATTSQQRALSWGAGSERVGAVEERLAGLAATAPEPEAANRAQALGEAVRRAHLRLDQIVVADEAEGLNDQLWATARDVEAAVARSRPVTAGTPAP